jgi:hypothetical protein
MMTNVAWSILPLLLLILIYVGTIALAIYLVIRFIRAHERIARSRWLADVPGPTCLSWTFGQGAMKTPQWIKKLGGHAGELYVAAELSKRGIPNALLPENFLDDDLIVGRKDGSRLCFVQVKACHPDRAKSFILRETDEKWTRAQENEFVLFVWLGSPRKNESPQYWVAKKKDVGSACMAHSAHGTHN